MKRAKRWLIGAGHTAVAVYAALAFLILGPTLLKGYILALDMVFTPHLPWPHALTNTTLVEAILHALNFVVPSQILEKLILFAIFTLSGLGMHRLVPVKSQWARYAAGVLYVINPFTYSRLMAGQYLVLAGYALMPWFIAELGGFVRKPGRGTAWRLAAWTIAIGFVSLHYLGFAAISAVMAVGLWAWRERKRPQMLKRLAMWSGGVGLGALVVNSFWLIPLLLHRTYQAALISVFDERYFLAFATVPDATFGQMLNTLGLYGFWGDAQSLYTLPKAVFGWWWVIALILFALAGVGAVKNWRRERFIIVLMLSLGIVGFVLAQGIMGSPFAGFNDWLLNHMPFYRGYREPGKFIGLIALGLCYLFGLGVGWVLERADHAQANTNWLPGLLVALPLLYTPTMLWGAGGQLHAVNYPNDWYALNRKLDAEKGEGKVLFLPWHQYMTFGFAGRLISNPAPRFFDRATIAGDNSQIGLIEYQSETPLSQAIQHDILSADTANKDISAHLRILGFEYVVLAKEADYKAYAWLDHTPGLVLVSDTKTLKVYKPK